MRNDPGSNYTIVEALSALSRAVATYTTASVNHADGGSAAFAVSCGTFATSFVATLQHSPDNTNWTDEADTTAGNTVSLTLTEAGSGVIKVPNPRDQYSRLSIAVGGTNVFGVTSMLGPLRSIAP